jgi:hypothetical protein
MRILQLNFHDSFQACYDAFMSILRDRRGFGHAGIGQQGFGMLELVISLALVIAATYFMMNRKIASGNPAAAQSAIENAQKRLEAQGVQVPADIAAAGVELQQVNQAHEKSVDCASSESTTCRIENAPAPSNASSQ